MNKQDIQERIKTIWITKDKQDQSKKLKERNY